MPRVTCLRLVNNRQHDTSLSNIQVIINDYPIAVGVGDVVECGASLIT
jgi:hypothetical protein